MVSYFRTWSRRNSARFYGRAQPSRDQPTPCSSPKTHQITSKLRTTKVHRLVWFSAPVLTSEVHKLQNSRFGVRKRQKGKSDAPVETRGEWQKAFLRSRKKIKLHSSHPLRFGVFQHHPWQHQRKDNLRLIPEHQCTCWAERISIRLNWKQCGFPRIPSRFLQPMGKRKQIRKQHSISELDLFVTGKLLDDTSAVLSLGKLSEDHGYSYEWTSGHL